MTAMRVERGGLPPKQRVRRDPDAIIAKVLARYHRQRRRPAWSAGSSRASSRRLALARAVRRTHGGALRGGRSQDGRSAAIPYWIKGQ
jgi:hypothetical protein